MHKKDKKEGIMGENLTANHKRIYDKEEFLDLLDKNPSLEIKMRLDYNVFSRNLVYLDDSDRIVVFSFCSKDEIKYNIETFWKTPLGIAVTEGNTYIVSIG